MKKITFKFEPALWFGNKALRSCSPAARGFWVDLLCLCHPTGYLMINNQPASDPQIARMIGEPVGKVSGWLKELGEAGIYSVSDQGMLFSSHMVKSKKEKPVKKFKIFKPVHKEDIVAVAQVQVPAVKKEPQKPVKMALEWYKSPAGWIRKGQENAMEMKQDEPFEQYQVRVAARLPVGTYLDSLTESQKKQIEASRPKDPTGKMN